MFQTLTFIILHGWNFAQYWPSLVIAIPFSPPPFCFRFLIRALYLFSLCFVTSTAIGTFYHFISKSKLEKNEIVVFFSASTRTLIVIPGSSRQVFPFRKPLFFNGIFFIRRRVIVQWWFQYACHFYSTCCRNRKHLIMEQSNNNSVSTKWTMATNCYCWFHMYTLFNITDFYRLLHIVVHFSAWILVGFMLWVRLIL